MGPGDAHRAGLGVQSGGEGLAQRLHTAPDPLLGFQDQGIVPRAQQFVGGHEAGHPRADDDDPLRGGRLRAQAVSRQREVIVD